MSKIKKKFVNTPRILMELFTNLYLLAMVGIFPLFYLNNYINIVEAKLVFFRMATMNVLVLGISFFIIECIRKRVQEKRWGLEPRLTTTAVCGIIFALVICASCILSPAGAEAFWGEQGRRLGGWVLLLCIITFFVISYYYQEFQGLIWIFLIANFLVWLFAILQFLGIDLLHMYDNLVKEQQTYFLSTIGNINVNSGYTCVILAILMGLYFQSGTKLSRCCYGGMLVMGFYAAYASRSQSWILGIGTSAAILLWAGLESREKLIKAGEIWLLFLTATILLKITLELAVASGTSLATINFFKEDSFFKFIISKEIIIIQIAVWILVFFLMHKYHSSYRQLSRGILLGAGILVVVAACFTVFPMEDSFGSHRGYIWRITWEEYWKLPMIRKLIGYGPNSFLQFIDVNRGEEMRALYTKPFIDAHNEALQFLSVTGILGMLSYMGMQVTIMVRCAKEYMQNPIAFVGFIAIGAYLAQGLVNNPQVLTTPLLFVFMGLMENKLKNKDRQ